MKLTSSLLLVSASVLANGFLGLLFGGFAGAAAGNAGEANFFIQILLPVWISSFVALAIASYVLAFKGRPIFARRLPAATVPVMVLGFLIAAQFPPKKPIVESVPVPAPSAAEYRNAVTANER